MTGTGSFSNWSTFFVAEDPRTTELRRRVLVRVNSDQRFVRYVVDTYRRTDVEPFFQALCARERELQTEIVRRTAAEERFRPSPGQSEVPLGESKRPPEVPLVVEEVTEISFLPYLEAAARGFRK